MRSVPGTYEGLATAIDVGEFPWERAWIDFKRRLYPDDQADRAGRAKVSLELAKDMASMAVHGGYLVYGVAEDKVKHLFTVDPMELPPSLHETVDAVARDRVTPSLSVIPNLLADSADTARGFLVIEIPASVDAPHMVEGVYWGRSETGKVRLQDGEVERLILARNRRMDQLREAMADTAHMDPVPSQSYCHFYFTAVPATGWPDMFAGYTRDRQSRRSLSQLCTGLLNEIMKGTDWQQRPEVSFGSMIHDWRSHEVAAGWLGTWTHVPEENHGRAIGVDDDGPVRYLNLGASAGVPWGRDIKLVREVNIMFETLDTIRLLAKLSDEVGYRGSWLLGVEFAQLGGHMSQVNDPSIGFVGGSGATWGAVNYLRTTRAAALEIQEKPTLVVDRLLRQLLRGLGTEGLLELSPFASA